MKKEHKYAQVLRWIADGEAIQWKSPMDGWKIISSKQLLENVANDELDDLDCFRLKPRTITVNGREIVAPETSAPENGDLYSVPSLSRHELVSTDRWDGGEYDQRVLQRGLVHLTKENAIAHAKAMLGID